MNPDTNSEVMLLRAEAKTWHGHYRDERKKAQSWKEWAFKHVDEVAMLRELLNRAIEIAEDLKKSPTSHRWCKCATCRKLDSLHGEARLAPAPEEPNPKIQVIREKMSPEKSEEVRKIRLLIGEDELEQIANTPEPAPEEPVTEKDTKVSVKEPVSKRLCKDCGQPHSKHTLHPYETICPEPVSECHHPDIKGWCHACFTYTGYEEPAPEWREFTIHQEYPQAGDEWRHGSCNPSVWWKVHGGENYFDQSTRFRTLRPLPVQEEPMSIPQFSYAEGSPQTDYSNGVFPSSEYWTKPKQEEMPLEDELKRIEWHQNYSDAVVHHAIADAIRYLRDEIESLNRRVGGVR